MTKAKFGPENLELLYNPADYDLRYRNRNEIIENIGQYINSLDLSNLSLIDRELLINRYEYLSSIVSHPKPKGLFEALVGMSYIEPFALTPILVTKKTSINVFLARDAAGDYLCAHLLDKLNIVKNNSTIVYISRKTLKYAYSYISKISKTVKKSSELQKILRNQYKNDIKFKKDIDFLVKTISESKASAYNHVRYIDSWAEGVVFTIIKFAHYIGVSNKLIPKQRLSFASVNDKHKLRVVKNEFDYHNVKSSLDAIYSVPNEFYESFLRKYIGTIFIKPKKPKFVIDMKMVGMWYKHAGTNPPEINNVSDYAEFMSARIYKPFNHFGSLNLGHPFDWDDKSNSIVLSNAYKVIGNQLRTMLMINAVIGYRDGYKVIDSGHLSVKPLSIKKDELNIINSDYIYKLINDNNEHFATSSTEAVKTLIANLDALSQHINQNNVLLASREQNYDFQYFINQIKNINCSDFNSKLAILDKIYGKDVLIKFFAKSVLGFLDEIENVAVTQSIIASTSRCIVFDIDGTLSPIDQSISMLVRLLKRDFKIGFITGRPASYCEKIIEDVRNQIGDDGQQQIDNMIFYAAHGSVVVVSGKDRVYKNFSNLTKLKISLYSKLLGLKVVSKRDYRYILQLFSKDTNQNHYLWQKKQLSKYLFGTSAGVYLSKWNTNKSEYNAVDVCSMSRQESYKKILSWAKANPNNTAYFADEPNNSDKDVSERLISVKGYSLLKTQAIVNRIIDIS